MCELYHFLYNCRFETGTCCLERIWREGGVSNLIVPRLYEDLSVLHQNTVPYHCYFIPTSNSAENTGAVPVAEDSDRAQMLSGCKWLFRYYPGIHALREEFYRQDYVPDDKWQREDVPFCWQMRGYDENQYTNIRYPFPFDPPYVPQNNPCGTYLHRFTWHKTPEAPRTYLNFEGVDSCFFVWLNGVYVGYSQVTHHTSEFEVTELLKEGENLLAVLVLKWCDGSYLEDQDKFRMSGIIRDVYLVSRPENHIEDYVITTALSQDMKTAELKIKFSFSGEKVPVHIELAPPAVSVTGDDKNPKTDGITVTGADSDALERQEDISLKSGSVLETDLGERDDISLRIDNPYLWNAESPNLYTLILKTPGETITEKVGFRRVCVEDGVLFLNDSPIKFRGVNRHESDPVTGSAVTREQVERDLRLIKDHNFNAVRASHYPDVPYFYQLCDEMGLYVIDEADNESHGTAPLYFNEDDYAERMRLAHVQIADNPAFVLPTLDRVRSMVLRNRNRPCILVWSMGNECGYGCTFEESLRWTKETDPTRLTHYESAFYMPRDREYDVSNIDLFGRMYPPFDEVTDYLKSNPKKPLLLVEYCHSMGNSPGDFQEYRDLTEKYPRLCGGFVWEFCDHAVLKGYTDDGRPMYLYGGDHGELQHDGNFCLDGLVYPDRRPHTGLYEYKNVHRPLRAAYDLEEGLLTIGNYWDFTDPSTCVQAHYTLTQDGAEIESGVIEIPHIAPHDKEQVPLELEIPDKGRCFLLITYIMEKAAGGLAKGHILGFDEIRIRNADSRFWRAAELSAGEGGNRAYVSETPVVRESDNQITVSGRNFTYTMDTLSGLFTSFAVSGREFLKAPIDFNLWRAPTDNDSAPAELWRWERLDHTVTRAYEVTAGAEKDTVVIRVRQSVAAMSVKPFLRINAGYTIYPDGRIRADIEADKDPEVLTLPRLGLRMFLSPELANAEYYGIGPKESYIDKCRSGTHGLFTSKVADLHEDYIRPQENGSHCDCDYVRLDGEDIEFTVVSADEETFSFNASLYTQEELESKRHNYELEKCGDTVLCIDHRMAGIGSKSCGPDLSKEYRVDADHYEFAFIMKPDRTLFKN